ncbi:MAG: MBL fold metallo-hydrolase [Myxococcales bacterium]|nr:MBL fold metallo-hydrolase [Myxococcales bacterium]
MNARARHTIDCDVLPRFTAAYLRLAGEECAFIEAHTAHAVPRLLAALTEHGRSPEDVRWVVVTHAHLDHAAGAGALLERCPNATLLAHPRAAAHLIDPAKLVASATRVYGEARFAELYGRIVPIPAARVRALDDGATFGLGADQLSVHYTEGHAKHHFVVDDPALESVYTGDAFGLVYPALQSRGRFAIPSTSPIDFDPVAARRAIDLILGLKETHACLTHFGAIDDAAEVASQLRAWIDRSETWLDQCVGSDASAEDQTARVEAEIRAALASQISSADDWELLSTDIRLNAQGIVVAAQRRQRARQAS